MKRHIRKSLFSLTMILLLMGVMTAYAGLSFNGGISASFGSLHVTARIVGFGNDTDTVFVTTHAFGSNLYALCQNKGGNIAPGQNPLTIDVFETSQAVQPARNGNADVSMTVNLLPSAREAGCPNGNWKVVDLVGTLFVDLTAVNTANGDSAMLPLRCDLNQPLQTVNCVILG